MNASASRICLTLYALLMVVSCCLLSMPGEYYPFFMGAAGLAVVPVLVGPPLYRIVGILALVLAIVLIVFDLIVGAHSQSHPG